MNFACHNCERLVLSAPSHIPAHDLYQSAAKMDQTQQKALNALEPYILLSKSANSPRAAADLVTQATSAPNTFVFAELLQTPNIQALQTASSEYSPYLTLLEIFAWGTWSAWRQRQRTRVGDASTGRNPQR